MSTDKKTIHWYNQNADSYASHVSDPLQSTYHSYYEKPALFSLFPEVRGKDVLSLGCGSGVDIEYIKNKGASRAVGIDISENLIKIAKEHTTNCEFHTMDMESTPFSSKSFDIIFSSLALHYIENWDKVFAEIFRLLKPGGTCIFSCMHPLRTAMKQLEHERNTSKKSLSITTDKINKTVTIEGDYMHKHLVDGIGNMGVSIWHKTMSDILNTVINVGLTIDHVCEPKPLPELKEQHPSKFERLDKIPEFLIVRAIKN